MEKTWVKDIKEGERVKAIFAVARKAVPTAKSGKTYLAATLVDRTGELEARSFDRVEELAALFDEKDLVEVEGAVGSFQGRPQLRIESVARVDAAAAAIDLAEFAWVPPPEPRKPEKAPEPDAGDAIWTELLGLVEAITDPHVKDLVKAFLADDDVAARLRRAPAAKTVHHAYPGGLLEHTVSCIKLSHRVADQYPQLDRDLLVAGAFFHDIGKIRELGYERNVEYTDEGRLVGHLVMAAQWIHEKARRVGVPRDLEQHVVHLVLAHHGKLEYGSPKAPATLEALVTHFIDDLDSRMNSWVGLMGREGGTRRWTDAQNVHGHHIWRGTLPTVQVEKRSPPPELMTPVIYVPRPAAPGSQPQRRQQEKKQKPPRPPRPERAEARQPAEAGAAPAPAASGEAPAPRPERSEAPPRADRPPRPDRPDRGPRGPGGPGGPGDRKPRYMGPRLPGDKGPGARADKPKNLTHNPFAALAAKVEAGRSDAPPEAALPSASEGAVEAAPPAPAPEVTSAPPPEVVSAPPPAAEPAPAPAADAPPPGGDPAP
ncbi:MAG TPA: HD domain-containing protein [Anaeromyxobacteraceae bacterium]|nr:HD domain-containing protein [Anaeromyxobacteraceae bacterium]